MFIYNGKFTCQNASNETITVVFPAGFELNDPVNAYWQWSNDPKLDNKKSSVANSGFIRTVTKTSDGSVRRIHFSFSTYSFDGSITTNFDTLSLTMFDVMGSPSDPFDLSATHINVAEVRSVVVYTGTLNWSTHAKEEMATIVVPYGVTKDAFFGLYHQWTRDPFNNTPKQNVAIDGRFQDVKVEPTGDITATYTGTTHTYKFRFNEKKGTFILSKNRGGEWSCDNNFALAYQV